MRYLKETVMTLSVLLVGTGCSEHPTQRELTNETIELNNGSLHLEVPSSIPNETKKMINISNDNHIKLTKLTHERDEAIETTLNMKKSYSDLESQKSALDIKIQRLMDAQNEIKLVSQEKIKLSDSKLDQTQKIIAQRDAEIKKLMQERDEAIQITLKMKEKIAQLESQKSGLDTKIQTLMKTQSDYYTSTKQKADNLTSLIEEVEKVSLAKDADMEKLKQERDEAIQITLKMKQNLESLESQKSDLDTQMQKLIDTQNENTAVSQEKIATTSAALLAAQQLNTDRNTEIAKLTQERDKAVSITAELNKSNENYKEQKVALKAEIQRLVDAQNDNHASLKEKTAHLTSLIEEAEKMASAKDADMKKLKLERDEAIKVTLKMKQDRDEAIKVTLKMKQDFTDIKSQKSALDTKIKRLMDTQNKNSALSKEKIATTTAALLAAQQLASDKDAKITQLIAERDEAIKVTLEMKKVGTNLKTQKSELDGKIQTLMQAQNESQSSSKEKISKLSTLIAEAEKMALTKDADVAKLIKERDAAIQVSVGLKKDYEAQNLDLEKKIETLKQNKTQNESTSKEKISTLTTLLEEAKEEIVAHDADIQRLTKERDAAIQASLGMQKELDDNQYKMQESAKKLVISNIVNTFKLSKVEFETGSAILTNQSTMLLDKVSDIMKDNSQYNYKIQGHTDSQGNEESNMILSKNRAESVKAYLVSKGIDEGSLSTEGFGSSTPIADNATKEGRLQNRRVVFEIVN